MPKENKNDNKSVFLILSNFLHNIGSNKPKGNNRSVLPKIFFNQNLIIKFCIFGVWEIIEISFIVLKTGTTFIETLLLCPAQFINRGNKVIPIKQRIYAKKSSNTISLLIEN
nr:hypothetical protein [Clostridium estertheticum]